MTLIVALLYLLALVGIGLWSISRTRNDRDFYLAGSRLGLLPVSAATMSSIMSGFVFVGGPGLFYSVGLSSFWITISSSFTGAMMCWLLARPLQQMAEREGCLTIPDIVFQRYRCRFSSAMATVGIMLGVVGYLATQLEAVGFIIQSQFPVSPGWAALIAMAVLVFYTVAGGMIACVYTDILQGALILFTSLAVFFVALKTGGGLSAMSYTLVESDAGLMHPWGTVGAFGALSWFFVFSIGSLGQPHVVHKMMMVRDLRVLRYFPLILALAMVLCGAVWLGGGLAIKSLVLRGEIAPLRAPDFAITEFLRFAAPAWLQALAYTGVLAAIMSTVDSFANVGAGAMVRDFPRALRRPLPKRLLWGRLATFSLFCAAYLFARYWGGLVAYLGIFGFSTFAAALTPTLALGLNWPEAGPWAARLSILTGLIANLLFELLSRAGLYDLAILPSACALALSFMVFIGAALLLDSPTKISAIPISRV
ncbi:MAG: hypothetical protein HY645_13605 [Acidobacteria bacterium]|nr:hypothetical protein [Acidobacteriota bacterium]